MTVSAFSIALAEVATRTIVTRLGKQFITPLELEVAAAVGKHLVVEGAKPEELPLQIRRSGEEVPAVMDIAASHTAAWQKAHSRDPR